MKDHETEKLEQNKDSDKGCVAAEKTMELFALERMVDNNGEEYDQLVIRGS